MKMAAFYRRVDRADEANRLKNEPDRENAKSLPAESRPAVPDDPADETISEGLLNELLPVSTSAASIRAELNRVVIGQDVAKTALSVLLSAHLGGTKRANRRDSPNALLIGPTGVGKTHTVQTAAAYLGLPFVNVDSTALVPSDAIDGMTIESVLIELIVSAETILARTNLFAEVSAVDLAKRGLIFLDEFDKIRAGNDSDWNLRVQRRLLRLIEGSFNSLRETRGLPLNTSDIIFLASGTFDGIKDPAVTARRAPQLTSTLRDPDRVVSSDLVAYGFLPELIARLPVLVPFEPLTSDDLYGILSNPSVDPTWVWYSYFRRMGKSLLISEEAKRIIAQRAAVLNMGARGLQQVMFPMLARLSHEVTDTDQDRLVLTEEICEAQLRLGW